MMEEKVIKLESYDVCVEKSMESFGGYGSVIWVLYK